MTAVLSAAGIGSNYAPYYAVYLAVVCLAGLAVAIFRRALPPWFRVTSIGLIGIALVRLVAFDNPVALRFYQRHLTPEKIGVRQWAALDIDIAKYASGAGTPRLANLAVGSSQVGAIFSHWVSDPPEPMPLFSMAGMKTLDYFLYRREIAALEPDRVILYLSAFDLSAAPELYSLPLAPAHPADAWSVVQRLRRAGVPSDLADGPIHEYIASQLSPEYHYGFLFKAMVKPWLSVPLPAAPAHDEDAGRRVAEFISYYYPEWLDYNVGFLKDFLAFCRERGIEVVIAEGQVNPEVRSGKVDALNAAVRARFAELELIFPNVRFVPIDDVYRFEPADYADLTHVHREAAMKYTAKLSATLRSSEDPSIAGPCGLTFVSGWHAREQSEDGWLRWSSGEGIVRARARQPLDLVLSGQALSLARPNVIDVVVEGQETTNLRIDDPAWRFHTLPAVRVHVDSDHPATITFQSLAAPAQIATDSRLLAMAIKNLSLGSADSAVSCEVTADAPPPRRPRAGSER